MSRHVLVFVLLAAAAAPLTLFAHEGHDHKVLGTIVSVDAKRVVVKPTEGPDTSIVIAAATTFHKAKEIGKAADLKAGVRVVVNVGAGKEPLTAKDIQYAAPPTTTSKS